ncbi:MAG: NAD(P)-dependent oxidoreductase [Desulfobacterales bacterium]|nr:MAG: NAD(P)-dependent oxidoreductase [Desulfobacterales bacterium]
MEHIGIVGTGVMGLTATGKIISAGHTVSAYDVSSDAAARAGQLGAQIAETPAEVAGKSDMVLLFLPGPVEVKNCVAGADGLLSAMQAGKIIVDMSTSDPTMSEQMAKLADRKGIDFLDAPVLGRPISVGQWALPVGGNNEAIERCKPVFQLFAANIFHAGPVGAGHKIKLLNQLMFGAINAMAAEMMAIADKIGIAPRRLFEIITASQAGTVSNLFKELGQRIAEENYENPTFTVNLLVKDIKLAVQMAREKNAPPILARTIELINEVSQVQGLGNQDTAIMWQSYRNIWGSE